MATKVKKKTPAEKREEYRKMDAVLGLCTFIFIVNLLIFMAKTEGSIKDYLIYGGFAAFLGISAICEKGNRYHGWEYIIPMSLGLLILLPLIKITGGEYSFIWVFAAELIIVGLVCFGLFKKPKKKNSKKAKK